MVEPAPILDGLKQNVSKLSRDKEETVEKFTGHQQQ